ncbi:hypothetical protein NEUTE2DRAFT_170631 [Neurospora tetrasperma FGSC 2509]|nr:hypothetical protein NEUTE2DRAFT_170631 [Neurospora tetrasperma FGSC 2509]
MITGILSFMTDEAAVWARPHIDELSDGRTPFNADWDEFVKQFSAKFEPVDAKNEAKQKLMSIKQGDRTFADYLSDFETYSRRTGWSNNDLYDRLKSGMNSDYLNRLSYFAPLATDYNLVKNYGATIDLQKADLAANQGKPVSQPRSSQRRAPPVSATRTQWTSMPWTSPLHASTTCFRVSRTLRRSRGNTISS